MNHLYILISFFIGALVFSLVRKIIFSIIKKRIKNKSVKEVETPNIVEFNSSIGKVYSKDDKEHFQWKKFLKIFDLGNGVEWIKSIKEILDLRKLTIYLMIAGCIYGYGWYKGKLNTPVQVNLAYDKEFKLDLNGEYLHKPKFSNDLYIKDDKTNQIIKHIKAKDFPELRKKLSPIGFQLEPIFIGGGSIGELDSGFEAGAGLSWLRYWRWNIDSFLTNRGIYPLATSYQLTDNSGAGLGVGKGWSGDNRIILYYKWKF